MKISGIYKIQSKTKPDRCYIGSAINITQRWRCHLSSLKKGNHHSIKLQRHYDKYGIDDLSFLILLECEKSSIINNEQYFIDLLNPWFNIRLIANSNIGIKRSKEIVEKNRKSHIGIASPFKGKHRNYSKEALAKMSRKGKPSGRKGKKASLESIRKNREKHLGQPAWNKGQRSSEKTKQKQREYNIQHGIKPPSREGATPWNKGNKNNFRGLKVA
jgi:group I intron endonuclease